MNPSYDPGVVLALVEDKKGELQIEPLNAHCAPNVVRVSASKTALKSWRRVFEFKKLFAANGRKEIRNGNCNS